MTVKELIDILLTKDKSKEVKIVYDGPDTYNYLPIKTVDNSLYHVIIEPDTSNK